MRPKARSSCSGEAVAAISSTPCFDQDGKFLEEWTQFSRPSGIYIDKNDIIYVADSASNAPRHPGWKRGIRIGSAKDGSVTAFIPDPADPPPPATNAAEGVAADAAGNIYCGFRGKANRIPG
jgi:sugar lactone lactonase YvrE